MLERYRQLYDCFYLEQNTLVLRKLGMCMRTVDDVINIYAILSQLIHMKGKLMRHFHLYEDIVNYSL